MDLTDEQWAMLKPLLPDPTKRADGRGRPWREAREVLDGVPWVLRNAAPWRDLPEHYPPYQTCHRRFQRWVKEGVLSRVLKALAEDLEARGGLDLSECLSTAPSWWPKRGSLGGEDQARQGYEAHGGGGPLRPSSRRAHGEC
jgi:transposase